MQCLMSRMWVASKYKRLSDHSDYYLSKQIRIENLLESIKLWRKSKCVLLTQSRKREYSPNFSSKQESDGKCAK